MLPGLESPTVTLERQVNVLQAVTQLGHYDLLGERFPR